MLIPILAAMWLGTLRNDGQIWCVEFCQLVEAEEGGRRARTAFNSTLTHWPPETAVMPSQNIPSRFGSYC